MNFDKNRFEDLKDVFELWWTGHLERPIIQVTLEHTSSDGGDFFASDYRKVILNAMYDVTVPVRKVAQIIDQAYDSVEYLGDAIPVFYMRPTGILGGYLGMYTGH